MLQQEGAHVWGTHSDMNAYVAGCLAVQQLGPLRMCLCTNPQWGHALQREGAYAGGHVQKYECACSQVPGDVVLFYLLNKKLTSTNFCVPATCAWLARFMPQISHATDSHYF